MKQIILILIFFTISTFSAFAHTRGVKIYIADMIPGTNYTVTVSDHSETDPVSLYNYNGDDSRHMIPLKYGGIMEVRFQGSTNGTTGFRNHYIVQLELNSSDYITLGYNWGVGDYNSNPCNDSIPIANKSDAYSTSSRIYSSFYKAAASFKGSHMYFQDETNNDVFFLTLLPPTKSKTKKKLSNKTAPYRVNN